MVGVVAFMIAHDFKKHVAFFEENEVNGKKFLALTDEKLIKMGLTNAYARAEIMVEVEEQKGLCWSDRRMHSS